MSTQSLHIIYFELVLGLRPQEIGGTIVTILISTCVKATQTIDEDIILICRTVSSQITPFHRFLRFVPIMALTFNRVNDTAST